MANIKRRKHKRAVREPWESYHGLFIPDGCKFKIALCAVAALLIVFLKGMIIGYYAGKKAA